MLFQYFWLNFRQKFDSIFTNFLTNCQFFPLKISKNKKVHINCNFSLIFVEDLKPFLASGAFRPWPLIPQLSNKPTLGGPRFPWKIPKGATMYICFQYACLVCRCLSLQLLKIHKKINFKVRVIIIYRHPNSIKWIRICINIPLYIHSSQDIGAARGNTGNVPPKWKKLLLFPKALFLATTFPKKLNIQFFYWIFIPIFQNFATIWMFRPCAQKINAGFLTFCLK